MDQEWIAEELQQGPSAPAFLQALFNGHPDMLFVIDAQGSIVAANSNSLENLHYTRADLEGKPLDVLIPPALRPRHAEHMRHYFHHPTGRTMASGISLSIVDALGTESPIDIQLWPFAAGALQYVLAICRGLETESARRQMHIHALVETAQEYAVNLLDAEGRILTWNEGAQRMYGLSSLEALGKDYSVLFTAAERASGIPVRRLGSARAATNVIENKGWRAIADGSEIFAEIRTTAVRNTSGQVTGFIHVLHDATKHKKNEEDLRTANQTLSNSAASLEKRVYERTKELEETLAELKKSKREIESYATQVAQDLREKEVLLREIHHRVKNNLQVTQSLMKMRARTLASPEAREAIESAIQRVHVIAAVHEKLYQMSDISCLSLSEYIREVVEGAVNSGAERAERIELEIDADELPIAMDAAVSLGLLVNELVLNCLKHGFKDHNRGRIAVSITGDAGRRRLVIEDNGCGLPPDFDPGKCASMGLKLAVSLAKRLGGELKFSSTPGCRVEAELTRL
jgi:PAS domain S-box-containing protein